MIPSYFEIEIVAKYYFWGGVGGLLTIVLKNVIRKFHHENSTHENSTHENSTQRKFHPAKIPPSEN